MRKNLIRLTESDLHRIIENSVKRCLTEMDHETYRNAARKERGNARNSVSQAESEYHNRRANRFDKHADDTFNRKFKVSDDDKKSESRGDYKGVSDRALRGYKELSDYNNGNREYSKDKGKWVDKQQQPQRKAQVSQQKTDEPKKKKGFFGRFK